MKHILFFFLLLPFVAFAQWPAAPNKIRLGNQTTGDGLVVRTAASPSWTPSSINNAWLAFDTVAVKLYYYDGGAWNEYTGGSEITDVSVSNDTLYITTTDSTFVAVFDDANTNFANTNLTFTGNRVHNLSTRTLTIADGGTYPTFQQSAATDGFTIASSATDLIAQTPGLLQIQNTDTITVTAQRIRLNAADTRVQQVSKDNALNRVMMLDSLTGQVYYRDVSSIAGGGGTVTGTGTTNTLPKWTSSTALGNSIITDNGALIGVGTATPAYKLDVYGTASTDGINTNIGLNFKKVANPPQTINFLTRTLEAGSELSVGTYYYRISYYNAIGETSMSEYNSVTTTSGNQRVRLDNIPISSDPTVIGRKIYRGNAGWSSSYGYLIATIADNTTTSYLDTTPDNPGYSHLNFYIVRKQNKTNKLITVSDDVSLQIDPNFTSLGYRAGGTTSLPNTLIGAYAGEDLTTGNFNTIVGQESGRNLTTGFQNSILGSDCMVSSITASYNIAIGPNVLYSLSSGAGNVALGYYNGNQVSGSSYNTLVGSHVSVGQNLGAYNTGLGAFINFPTANGANQLNIVNNIYGESVNNTSANGKISLFSSRPINSFNVSPTQYSAGTASQSGTTITGVGTTFTSGMIGSQFVFNSGQNAGLITAVASTTSLTVSVSQTVTSGGYKIHYVGLQVTSSGSVGIGTTTPARTLHVTGEARITDLTTDTPTLIVGADADGDLGAITVGSGLSLSGGTLSSSVTDTHVGNTNLTLTGARTHSLGSNTLTFSGTSGAPSAVSFSMTPSTNTQALQSIDNSLNNSAVSVTPSRTQIVTTNILGGTAATFAVHADSVTISPTAINNNNALTRIFAQSVSGRIGYVDKSSIVGATNLAFSGSSSPVTLTSDTGTDVIFAAGSGLALSQSGGTATYSRTYSLIHTTITGGSTFFGTTAERPDNDTPGSATTSAVGSDFSVSGSTVDYTGSSGALIRVQGSISFSVADDGDYYVSMYKEGTEIGATSMRVSCVAGNYYSISLPATTTSGSTNDTFDLRIATATGNSTTTMHRYGFIVERVY